MYYINDNDVNVNIEPISIKTVRIGLTIEKIVWP
jgi:hypothetical protein